MLLPPAVVGEDLARESRLGILEIHPVLADDQLTFPVPVTQRRAPRQVVHLPRKLGGEVSWARPEDLGPSS